MHWLRQSGCVYNGCDEVVASKSPLRSQEYDKEKLKYGHHSYQAIVGLLYFYEADSESVLTQIRIILQIKNIKLPEY